MTERTTLRLVFRTWWPLAASWLMMGFELPAVSATIARLPAPEISLAAYGGIVFPLSLLIEGPIIMLLAASTELSRDRISYRKLRRFMIGAGAALTVVHLAVAATPLFDLVVGGLLDAPEEIREPARIGLLIMTPWTWSIAYRRFQQGVLIRFGRSRTVGIGTAVRLFTNVAVLAAGFALGTLPGIVVGTLAVASGVLVEAAFVAWAVRPILRDELPEDAGREPLTRSRFLQFYVPLAMTSVLSILFLPLGSAAMSRLPRPIDSLAVWPVVSGLTFTLRSLGFAYNEVVVALLDRPGAYGPLLRFTLLLTGATSCLLLLVAATPLGRFWFGDVSALSETLTALGSQAIWLAVLLPGLSVVHSWFQGVLVNAHRTRAISEAVAIGIGVACALLAFGIAAGQWPGIFVGLGAILAGQLAQAGWLWARSREVLRDLATTKVPAYPEMTPSS